MSQNLRHAQILDLARLNGRVSVEDLAASFDVTLQTIRRDLTELAEAGRLERVHGGAVLPSGTTNIAYEERRRLNAEAKTRIARIAAREIPAGTAVFLGIGTSTEALARELLYHDNLLIVTNNMNVAETLAGNPSLKVIVTGGTLRRADGGLVGEIAVSTIRQFRFEIAVIGCSGLDAAGDLLDFDLAEVGVNQAILNHTAKAILLADHSKLQRTAPVRVGSLADFDTLITDRQLPAPLTQACADWATKVFVA